MYSLQNQASQRGVNQQMALQMNNMDALRELSANSLRPTTLAIDPLPLPAVDPGLTEILRRPPVGLRASASNPMLPLAQNNISTSSSSAINNDLMMMQMMMQQQQQQQQRQSPVFGANSAYQERPRIQFTGFNCKTPMWSYLGPKLIYVCYKAAQNSPTVTTGGPTGFNFTEEQNKDSKQVKAREYQEELARQVREKQLQKQREKDEQERLDKRLLAETAQYNPFGRGGGGAPLKDRDGNIIANLSQAKNAANVGSDHPAQYSPRSFSQAPPTFDMEPRRNSAEQFLNSGTRNMFFEKKREVRSGSDEPSFARGGNGIFGEGKVIHINKSRPV